MILPYVVLSYLALFVFGLTDNLRSPLFPELLNEFAVSSSQGSWIFATSSAFSFAGSWVSSSALKKVDKVRGLYLSLIFLGGGFLLLGAARNFQMLLGAAAIIGVGQGWTTVFFNLLTTMGTRKELRPRIFSGLHSMYGLASLLAPLVVTWVYAWGGYWAECFYVGGISCVVLVIGASFVISREDKVQAFPIPEEGLLTDSRYPAGLWMTAFAYGFYVFSEILIGTRLALYLRLEKNFDLKASSYYMTAFFVCLLTSRILFSFRPIRLRVQTQLLWFLGLSLLVMVAGLAVHEGFLVMTGFFMGPFYALSVVSLGDRFRQRLHKALAVCMAIQSLFVVIMHLSFGWITDAWGINFAMSLGPLALFMAWLLLWRQKLWTES